MSSLIAHRGGIDASLRHIREAMRSHATGDPQVLERMSRAFEAQVNGVMYDHTRAELPGTQDFPVWPYDVAPTRLPKRHTPMWLHPKQLAYAASTARFNMLPCGRRTGKTEGVKRKGAKRACRYPAGTRGKVLFCAPTHGQANRIFWRDLNEMIPSSMLRGKPSISGACIPLWNGVDIIVTGMDVPERAEGDPLLGIVLDEFGNMKTDVWDAHVRPALVDTQGWADILGVPEGRNHYYDLWTETQGDDEWAHHHWTTEEVLHLFMGDIVAMKEIASAKRRMDPLTYDQEFNASFVTFEGVCYYTFSEQNKVRELPYDPKATLIFAFDFNVSPGVAVVCQEYAGFTNVIGEVFIPKNSNTPAVCKKLTKDWAKHEGIIQCFGDATGGAKGSAKVDGSDWDLIKMHMTAWGDRLRFKVPSSNPRERVRVNSLNSRICTKSGEINLRVDPAKCPHLIKDLEGVRLLKGGSGEIDKAIDPRLTHNSDALGYYITKQFPVRSRTDVVIEQF